MTEKYNAESMNSGEKDFLYNPLISKEDRFFIEPQSATGNTIRNLKIEDIQIPVSFEIAGNGRFRITGMAEGSESGIMISGLLFQDEAKINHILLDKKLQHQGIGEAVLSELEAELVRHGVNLAYSLFYTKKTVEFFNKHGYTIIGLDSLSPEKLVNLQIEKEEVDSRVTSDEAFDALKETESNTFKKILMMKKLVTEAKNV